MRRPLFASRANWMARPTPNSSENSASAKLRRAMGFAVGGRITPVWGPQEEVWFNEDRRRMPLRLHHL